MESLVFFVLFCMLYFVPTLAAARGRRGSVFVLNLFLGWTMLGWVLALVMAMRSRENEKEVA